MLNHQPQEKISVGQRSLLWLALSAMSLQPIVTSAQIIASSVGAGPQVTTAPNGVPLIIINAPSGAGVSRNQYQQFDVTTHGVILNNATGIVPTQLGGWIEGNPNLANGTARIILNEVLSGLPTNLRGYTEVAGSRAEVVIANPNGITCNGCGFINTSRGTLTTGTPLFGGNGSLDAFRVSGGSILLEGEGMAGGGAEQTDLLARTIRINAQLWGKQLNIIAGTNQINYTDLAVNPIAAVDTPPALAIDIAALGGMYAKKIHLLGTENGVGVAIAGHLAASGDISITSAGRIVHSGTLQAEGNLTLTAKQAIDHQGTTYATSNVRFAGDQINNTGTLASLGDMSLRAASITSSGTIATGVVSDGSITASGSLTTESSGNTILTGTTRAGGDIQLSGDQLYLADGQVQAGGDIRLHAVRLANTRNANITAGGSASINAKEFDNTGGLVGGLGGLSISSELITNRNGQLLSGSDAILAVSNTLDNTSGGIIAADRDISIAAPSVNNSAGQISAGRDIALLSAGTNNNAGTIEAVRDLQHRQTDNAGAVGTQKAGRNADISSAKNLTINASEVISAGQNLNLVAGEELNSAGTLIAGNELTAEANEISFSANSETAARMVSISATQTLSNLGNMSADWLLLAANRFDNSGSMIGGDISITAETFSNNTSSALVGATHDLVINSNQVSNKDGATLYALRDLTINGKTGAQGNVLDNSSAIIEAGRDLLVNMTAVNNFRTSGAVTPVVVSSRDLPYYIAYGDIWPSPPYDADTALLMRSPFIPYERERGVTISLTRDTVSGLSAPGQMQSGRHTSITAQDLVNSSSLIAAGGALTSNISGTLANNGINLYETQLIATHHMACVDYPSHSCRGGRADVYTSESTHTLIGSIASTLQGASSVTLNTGTLNQSNANPRNIVAPAASAALPAATGTPGATTPVITVPVGGLYHQATAPEAPYIIETDPRFASQAAFISSDYFLDKLGLNPANLQKRLGDAFVEAMVVRDEIFQLTGRRFLAGYQSENEQLVALYEAGVRSAQALSLIPGIALSAEQVAALTSDILWLSKEYVRLPDGTQAEALVPRVYLASIKAGDLSPRGALIAGGQVNLYAANDLQLQGSIQADSTLSALASNLVQRAGKLSAGTRIDLAALKDLAILGGSQQAGEINLTAGNNLKIERQSTGEYRNGSLTQTQEASPSLNAGRNLIVTAGQDISVKGAALSAGQEIALGAGNRLSIAGAARSEDWQATPGTSGVSTYHRQATFYSGSRLSAGSDITLLANDNLSVQGSLLNADNNINAKAGAIGLLASADQTSLSYQLGTPTTGKGVYAKGNSDTSVSTISQLNAQGSINLDVAETLSSEGAKVKAGQDINLHASNLLLGTAYDTQQSSHTYSNIQKRSVQQSSLNEQSISATGSILEAGRNLNMESTGNTALVGSALSAGQSLNLKTGGDLALLAAQSSTYRQINDYSQNRKKATTLNFNEQEVRQLLSTITIGNTGNKPVANISIGGNLSTNSGASREDSSLIADRMTKDGIVRGDSRQQVNVTRTGVGADNNPSSSQVLGNLKDLGIRNHSNESLKANDTVLTGQAALQQSLQSGLLQIGNDAKLQQQLKILLKPDGTTLTAQDEHGNVNLTIAGQMRVQEVFNTLLLAESFDTKKFADQGLAQMVTLVAAIALTVSTGGAGAGTLGASLTAANTTSALMINAAAIGMGSNMIGQLAGGASFEQAFQAGLKAGASGALMAGISAGINELVYGAPGNAPMSIDSGDQVVQSGTNASMASVKNVDALFTTKYWEQTALNATAKGILTKAQGGSFEDGFSASVIGSLAATGAGAIGDTTAELPLLNTLSHAALGCVAATASKQDCSTGALGGASSAVLARLIDGGTKDADLTESTRKTLIASGSVAGSIALAEALGKDTLTAGNAAANEVLNNFLYHYKGRIIAYDKNDNDKIIKLSEQDLRKLAAQNPEILNQIIAGIGKQDGVTILLPDGYAAQTTSSRIYDLNNPTDRAAIEREAEMGYLNLSNQNTRIYLQTGMDNTPADAAKSAQALSALLCQPTGYLNNATDGLAGDVGEYLPNTLTLKDVLSEYTYRTLNAKGRNVIITHSAGNEDARKALLAGALYGHQYGNLSFLSVGSPVSAIALQGAATQGGAQFLGQVNDWRDPVTYSKTAGITSVTSLLGGMAYGAVEGCTAGKGGGLIGCLFGGGTGTVMGAVFGGIPFVAGYFGLKKYHPVEQYIAKPQVQSILFDWIKTTPPAPIGR